MDCVPASAELSIRLIGIIPGKRQARLRIVTGKSGFRHVPKLSAAPAKGRPGGRPNSGRGLGIKAKAVGGAQYAVPAAVEDMRVDHRRADVAVAQQFLDGPDVVAVLEQVRGEGVS